MYEKSEDFWKQYFKQQEKTKPLIEDVIPEFLDGENKKTALEFVAYMRENKMRPTWKRHNSWNAMCKGKSICYIRLAKYDRSFQVSKHSSESDCEHWRVMLQLKELNKSKFEGFNFDEEMKNFICDNLYNCTPNCPNPCNRGNKIVVFGKELEKRCGSALDNGHLVIANPNEAEINCIKKLLELEKEARMNP